MTRKPTRSNRRQRDVRARPSSPSRASRSRRRTRIPLGLLAFAAAVGAALGLVIIDRWPAAPAFADSAVTARVIDGDTLDVAGQRVRLWGVDAPERGQSCEDAAGSPYRCGEVAKAALSELVEGRAVSCDHRDTDRYGRSVAKCFAGGEDLGGRLVRDGQAIDYTRYSRGAYLVDELRARRAKVGVWQGDFSRPEDWRRGD